MKIIKITQNKEVLVDDKDYDELIKYRWYFVDKPRAKYGYVATDMRNTNNKYKTRHVYMHRFLLNPPRNKIVDHINRNGLDNRRANLRICTYTQNNGNFFMGVRNKSGYKGVSWHKATNKWRATLLYKGEQQYLGIYDDKLEAAKAYNEAAIKYFGEFARPNVIG